MQRARPWLIAAAAVIAIGLIFWLWWRLDLRWRPQVIARRPSEIARTLDTAGWVSPHLAGPRLYIVAPVDCPACAPFVSQALPRLLAAGVDTRLILFAPPDQGGRPRSTPTERALVAALWLDRDWGLVRRWLATPPGQPWTAPDVPPADGDSARTAVVEASRRSVGTLTPLLRANGVRAAFPILVWWTASGAMHGCGCADPHAWARAEKELGA